MLEVVARHRFGEGEALQDVAAGIPEHSPIFQGLDAFGDDVEFGADQIDLIEDFRAPSLVRKLLVLLIGEDAEEKDDDSRIKAGGSLAEAAFLLECVKLQLVPPSITESAARYAAASKIIDDCTLTGRKNGCARPQQCRSG